MEQAKKNEAAAKSGNKTNAKKNNAGKSSGRSAASRGTANTRSGQGRGGKNTSGGGRGGRSYGRESEFAGKVYKQSPIAIACYVLAAIMLIYACYQAGSTVNQINEYYSSYGMTATAGEYIQYVLQALIEPLLHTVTLFMAGYILTAVRKIDPRNYVPAANKTKDAGKASGSSAAKDSKAAAKAPAERQGAKTSDKKSGSKAAPKKGASKVADKKEETINADEDNVGEILESVEADFTNSLEAELQKDAVEIKPED